MKLPFFILGPPSRGESTVTYQTVQIIFWASTGLFCLAMAAAATQYLISPKMRAAFTHLGFPSYFRVELAIAKYAGALALLLPVAVIVKEWAYAGFAITLVSAFIAHVAKKDAIKDTIAPVIMAVLLVVSFLTFHSMLAAS